METKLIRIQGYVTTHYDEIVEVSEEEYKNMKDTEGYYYAGWLDYRDPVDFENLQLDNVSVVDENGETIEYIIKY